jgi:hypothetical protein
MPDYAGEKLKVPKHVLGNPIPCQKGQKKSLSTCVDQTAHMPARTQNVSQHVLT